MVGGVDVFVHGDGFEVEFLSVAVTLGGRFPGYGRLGAFWFAFIWSLWFLKYVFVEVSEVRLGLVVVCKLSLFLC